MSLDALRQKHNCDWPGLERARKQALARLEQIHTILREGVQGMPFDSDDISAVAFGSLAREEWTSGSDLDWTLLIDGGVDYGHAHTANLLRSRIAEAGLKQPGPTGVFGTLTFSHGLIHLIGGEDDTNRNTTAILLLQVPLNRRSVQSCRRRHTKSIHTERLPPVPPQGPKFLQNDLHRFWRTICVDYANRYQGAATLGNASYQVAHVALIFVSGI